MGAVTNPPASAPINVERMLEDHLPDECLRVRSAITEREMELIQLRQRLALLESIGRAAGVVTDYVVVDTRTALTAA